MRSGKAQGAEPQNGGGMTTRSRENGYERQCNMLHGGATWRCTNDSATCYMAVLHGGVVACGATYYVEIVIGDSCVRSGNSTVTS